MDVDPSLGSMLVAALLCLVLIAILSQLETAILGARRSKLSQWPETPSRRLAEALIEAPERFQSSAHLGKSLLEALLYSALALGGTLLAWRGEDTPPVPRELVLRAGPVILLLAVAGYLAVTLLGETIPKCLAARRPEALLVRWARFIQVFTLLFTPALWVSRRLGRLLADSAGADPMATSRAAHSEEEIKLLLEGSAQEGVLEEDEKEMIHSIIEFTDTVARQVMVPRIDIHSVCTEATISDAVRVALESGHSRLPVYEETLDTIAGIVHVKDLLPHLVRNEHERSVREVMREPYFVPEGKMIDELLQEFRRHKSQMAIVVDEFGGTAGLVTVEDVLEEIVGEIEDEYDQDEAPAMEISTTGEGMMVDGRMTLEDVNEELGLTLPRGDYDTLGGFVFSLFGRPPEPGEQVEHDGLLFVAEAIDGFRIHKIRILRVEPRGEEEPPPAS